MASLADIHDLKIEILASHQKVTGTLRLRGSLTSFLGDPNETMILHNVTSESLQAGLWKMDNAPEGAFRRHEMPVIAMQDQEPSSEDDVQVERLKRDILTVSDHMSVKGWVDFPTGADPTMHWEMLFRPRYFVVYDATVTVHLPGQNPLRVWNYPKIFVNGRLFWASYLH